MELNTDWRSFQAIFHPRKPRGMTAQTAQSQIPGEPTGPVFVTADRDVIIAAYGEGEDLSDWIGAGISEIKTGISNREVIIVDREKIDQWFTQGLDLPHLYEQVEFYRAQAAPGKKRSKLSPLNRKHFLLDAMEGWWAKVLPSAYAIFVRLEGEQEQEHLVLIRRGKLETFYEPDLSSLGPERRKQPAEVVRYLSEKHGVPVQGVFLPEKEWSEWAASEQPWKEVARAVRSNRAKLVPFRWTIATLMASRAFLEI